MTAKQRAAQLRAIMKERDLSAVQVGAMVGRDANSVRCWVRGARNMPVGLLRLLVLLTRG